jgi:hypothetical protein
MPTAEFDSAVSELRQRVSRIMSQSPFSPEPPSPLRKDFGIFVDPGFLATAALLLLLLCAGGALLVYANTRYGIAPF